MARLIEVIEVITEKGHGDIYSPHRQVKQYYSAEGELLGVLDPELYTLQEVAQVFSEIIDAENTLKNGGAFITAFIKNIRSKKALR